MLDEYDIVELGVHYVAVVVGLVFSGGGFMALPIVRHAVAVVVLFILDGTPGAY